MFKTKTLIDWVENLMLMVGEVYEPKDYDRAYFEEIKTRLEELDEAKKEVHSIVTSESFKMMYKMFVK